MGMSTVQLVGKGTSPAHHVQLRNAPCCMGCMAGACTDGMHHACSHSGCVQPYLKFHNPKTFEDLSKPVPNFRSMNLKAGEVPRFFDNVLQGRASDAVSQVRSRARLSIRGSGSEVCIAIKGSFAV